MNKIELLQHIKDFASKKLITKDEVVDAYNQGAKTSGQGGKVTISKILYYIGGAIVFLGIVILILQNWRQLNAVAKILVTLGSSIAAYITATIFYRHADRLGGVGQAFFLISALTLPLGLAVLFDEVGFSPDDAILHSSISAICFLVFLVSQRIFKKDIFIVFSVLFGTWFFFGFTEFLSEQAVSFDDAKFAAYRVIITGISYIFLGRFLSRKQKETLAGILRGVGVFLFLAACLFLTGWGRDRSIIWEVLFPGIVLGVIFLSIYLKSKSFLVFGSIFLMAYILKLTGEYFADSMGWPLALVMTGLLLIGIGYTAFALNKKFIDSEA